MTIFLSNAVKIWKQPPVSAALATPIAFYVFISLLCCVPVPVRMFDFRFHHSLLSSAIGRPTHRRYSLTKDRQPTYVLSLHLYLYLSASFPTPFSGPIFYFVIGITAKTARIFGIP